MVSDNNRCIVCGTDNPKGLHLRFSYDEDTGRAETVFTPGPDLQGWAGIVHGGILVTLLDEVMAKAAARRGLQVLTGEITARFKNRAPVSEQLRCEGSIETVRKKIAYAKGAVYNPAGDIVAEATAKMMITDGNY